MVAVTAASFGYNLATDGPAPRPSGLLMVRGGGFDTRYRQWGTSGAPIVLVPGAVVGLAALRGGSRFARGVVFLDGDATPLPGT